MSEETSSNRKERLHQIIFESDTPAGRAFDIALQILIVLSVIAVILSSVSSISSRYGPQLLAFEWFVTIVFTIEYILRLYCVGKPLKYALSFFGIVDLLAVIPTYLSLGFAGVESLLVIRALRLLRIFRILKLVNYVGEAQQLGAALRASGRKIVVFLGAVLTTVTIMGALMYLVEGPKSGFTSIPTSIYWTIVTMTTVGYGDITPQTTLGKFLASILMIMGYGIIAVPTGIVTVELAGARNKQVSGQACRECSSEGHNVDAQYCKDCGAEL